MKKISVILLLILIQFTSNSQIQYEFDLLLTYENEYHDEENDTIKISKNQYLINSKNNGHYASITEKDSLNYRIVFNDFKNCTGFEIYLLKSEFIKGEFINVPNKFCRNCIKPKKQKQINDYTFLKLSDTLINGKNVEGFKLKSVNEKREKRKKLGEIHYYFDTESNIEIKNPVFIRPKAYGVWLKNKFLVSGIKREELMLNFEGEIVYRKKLVKILKIDKKVILLDN